MPNQKWPWKWREGILLLDLFLKRGGRGVSKDTPEIQELSRLLNSPRFRPSGAPSTYRNVNGLVMQYAGFIRLDSTSRSGLTASRLFAYLWQRNQDRPEHVAELADQIRKFPEIHDLDWKQLQGLFSVIGRQAVPITDQDQEELESI